MEAARDKLPATLTGNSRYGSSVDVAGPAMTVCRDTYVILGSIDMSSTTPYHAPRVLNIYTTSQQ